MSERQNRVLESIMTCLLIVGLILVARESAQLVQTLHPIETADSGKKVVVLDAGHGGIDPGKVGINGELEKDINLAIAHKVKRYLEQQDIEVIMTRLEDGGLYQEKDSNKKVVDMKARLAMIEEANPQLAVSIHQNSYSDASVSGMQVFYYKDSLKGKNAALLMQQQMIASMQPKKQREAKDNGTYYLLKKTTVPLIIVECGFLSNEMEAKLLSTDAYQEKVAWAIHLGILRYLSF